VYRNILGVLFGAAFDILTKIQESPPDSLTQQVRDAVAECADHLAAVEQTVQNASQRLKAGMEWIDNCIAAQGEHEKTAQAEEDEERHRGRRTPARAR
jgi:transcription elongation factor Elf1